MEKYYRIIEQNIKHIIDQNKQIAIYPMGMLGIYAKNILNGRYGRDGLYIDNAQFLYSDHIISFEKFCKQNFSDYIVLVCVTKKDIEKELIKQCEENGLEAASIRNPCLESDIDKTDFFKEIIEACKVRKAIGFSMVRIGKYSDGGYVMLDDFDTIRCCYSFGIGSEISWEEDMAERNLDLYCYDHTIGHMPGTNIKFHFFRNGIAGEDTPDGRLKSICTIMKQNGIDSKELILKMDIEGAEWEVIRKMDINILSCFKQITLELHNLTDINRKKEILDCLNKLKTYHQPIWIHGNNAGIAEKSGEYTVPEMLEITYVRKDSYEFEDCEYICPNEADCPNVDNYNEITLYGWGKMNDYV